jgi:hypothetical protein
MMCTLAWWLRLIGACFVETLDHIVRAPKVPRQQPFAPFRRVSLILHPVANQVVVVRTLEDLLAFVLFFAVDLNRWRQLGRAMPVGYVRLK